MATAFLKASFREFPKPLHSHDQVDNRNIVGFFSSRGAYLWGQVGIAKCGRAHPKRKCASSERGTKKCARVGEPHGSRLWWFVCLCCNLRLWREKTIGSCPGGPGTLLKSSDPTELATSTCPPHVFVGAISKDAAGDGVLWLSSAMRSR